MQRSHDLGSDDGAAFPFCVRFLYPLRQLNSMQIMNVLYSPLTAKA